MAVNLSPVFQDAQFTSSGALLNGGFIYSYVAGSSTPLATYTDNTGVTPQANPITLNARGEVASPIWLTSGLSYKLRLFDASNNFIREFDNIKGVNDTTLTIDQWVSPGLTPTYVSATQFTLAGDQTSAFQVGRRVKYTVTAGTGYGRISVTAFAALTTVTVVNDAGSALDSGLSAVQIGLITTDNTSFPVLKDSDFKLSGSADKTKLLAVEVDGLTAATTRTWTAQDKDITVAGLADVSAAVGTSRNAKMSVTSASATGTFTADEIVVETSLGGTFQRLASYSQAINLGTTGAGGMDTGAAPVSGFVSLYAIAKADGTKNILACAVGTSTASIYGGANMPSGYTYSALIGIWPTNGSSQFVPGYITGPFERKFNYQTYVSIFTATADKSTLTSQSISTAVPAAAKTASLLLGTATTGANYKCAAASDGTGIGGRVNAAVAASTTASLLGGSTALAGQFVLSDIPLITAQTVFVVSISGASTNALYVSDFTW